MKLFSAKLETFLIVGLGNPDSQYALTRHNCGWRALDSLAGLLNVNLTKKRGNALYTEVKKDGKRLVLIKPLTYMNNSGSAVVDYKRFYKTDNAHILVLYDDIDLPLGALRIRPNGSAGTHNGMRDIILRLGAEDFPRIRIGVGRPPQQFDLADYVLGRFPDEESAVFDRAAQAALCLVGDGIEKAMQCYSSKG